VVFSVLVPSLQIWVAMPKNNPHVSKEIYV
jgi:hypothetical protein